jgi:hypothetical protein
MNDRIEIANDADPLLEPGELGGLLVGHDAQHPSFADDLDGYTGFEGLIENGVHILAKLGGSDFHVSNYSTYVFFY